MPLLKPEVLATVISDIESTIHLASRNTIWAIGLIKTFVKFDPPGLELDSLLRVLAMSSFQYGEETFPKKLDNFREIIGSVDQVGEIYWPVYSYLFTLLPLLVRRPKIGGRKWTKREYQELESACYSRWMAVHKGREIDSFVGGNREMHQALDAWFHRDRRVAEIKEICIERTVETIENSFRPISGSVASKAFNYAVDQFLVNLENGFWEYLSNYWLAAGAFSFLSSNSKPLDPRFTKRSREFKLTLLDK